MRLMHWQNSAQAMTWQVLHAVLLWDHACSASLHWAGPDELVSIRSSSSSWCIQPCVTKPAPVLLPPRRHDPRRLHVRRYYSSEVHSAAFVLPTFARKELGDSLTF